MVALKGAMKAPNECFFYFHNFVRLLNSILLKFENVCVFICVPVDSSAIYGPTGTKLGREVVVILAILYNHTIIHHQLHA